MTPGKQTLLLASNATAVLKALDDILRRHQGQHHIAAPATSSNQLTTTDNYYHRQLRP